MQSYLKFIKFHQYTDASSADSSRLQVALEKVISSLGKKVAQRGISKVVEDKSNIFVYIMRQQKS